MWDGHRWVVPKYMFMHHKSESEIVIAGMCLSSSWPRIAIPKNKVLYALAAVKGFSNSCLSQHGVLSNDFQQIYITKYISHLTVVDCGNLTDPANGQVNHTTGTTFGQTATYSCDIGYNLVEDITRTCQATGNWSASAPTCQGLLLKGDLIPSICACTQ